MAGYFFLLGKIQDDNGVITSAKDILRELAQDGTYSTNLKLTDDTKKWSRTKVSIFADFFGMKENDYVFFFTDRKIYGVWRMINICGDCKYWSFQGANRIIYDNDSYIKTRLVEDLDPNNRCICFFEPLECYSYAIDMDEALTTYPNSFKSLRVMKDRSFIKLDDEETMALISLLHRRNNSATEDDLVDWTPPEFNRLVHDIVNRKISVLSPDDNFYRFSIESLLENFEPWDEDKESEVKTGINMEMAIESALVKTLSSESSHLPFDQMSFVTHQVSASPAKPIDYMEWIDVFGYSVDEELMRLGIPAWLAIKKFYVFEIKRHKLIATSKSGKETVAVKENKAAANQLMKYVDWVVKNYAGGNYPMVKGILVANDYDESFIKYCKEVCIRNYNNGYRNSTPDEWTDFELIKYSFDNGNISFNKILLDNAI